jgi:hypothetical protein
VETGVVVRLELDEREVELMSEVCREALSELRAEIVRTDRAEFRAVLKQREDTLKTLLARLQRNA